MILATVAGLGIATGAFASATWRQWRQRRRALLRESWADRLRWYTLR